MGDFGELIPRMRLRETRLQAHWVPRQIGAPVAGLVQYRPEFFFEEPQNSSQMKPWKRAPAGCLIPKDIDRFGGANSQGDRGAPTCNMSSADAVVNPSTSLSSTTDVRQQRTGEVTFDPVPTTIGGSIAASTENF